jgi:hypothetical protein
MRYLCLIYDDETRLAARSQTEAGAFMGKYVAFTEAPEEQSLPGP